MEIFTYLVPGVLGIILWLVINEFMERVLSKKTDEISRIRRTSRKPHSYEDHNTQFRNENESTISFWKKENIDLEEEDRMRQSIRKKVRGSRNE